MVTLLSVGVVLPVNFQVNNFSGVYFFRNTDNNDF